MPIVVVLRLIAVSIRQAGNDINLCTQAILKPYRPILAVYFLAYWIIDKLSPEDYSQVQIKGNGKYYNGTGVKEVRKKWLIGAVLLMFPSVLPVACTAPVEEIEQLMTEMGELGGNLDAVDASSAQGNLEGVQSNLEQAKIHLSNIDTGIDELEEKGIDSTQIERCRAASTYLHKGFEVIENILILNLEIAESESTMEGLSEGTKEDVSEAIDSLNELILLPRNTKSAIQDFLDYAANYYYNSPEDAKKLKVDTTIPEWEQLYDELDTLESEFEGWIDHLSES
jgi:hypothetical protein